MLKENESNLSLLVDHILVKKDSDSKMKKLSVRWNASDSKNGLHKSEKEEQRPFEMKKNNLFPTQGNFQK